MSSIVLQPGVKDMLLTDCKDFLASEEWCVEFRTSIVSAANFFTRYAERGNVMSSRL